MRLWTDETLQKRPFSDAASRNALNRFDAGLIKRYANELEGFDGESFGEDDEAREEIKALIEFVDDV